jgi:hypothetical protein
MSSMPRALAIMVHVGQREALMREQAPRCEEHARSRVAKAPSGSVLHERFSLWGIHWACDSGASVVNRCGPSLPSSTRSRAPTRGGPKSSPVKDRPREIASGPLRPADPARRLRDAEKPLLGRWAAAPAPALRRFTWRTHPQHKRAGSRPPSCNEQSTPAGTPPVCRTRQNSAKAVSRHCLAAS